MKLVLIALIVGLACAQTFSVVCDSKRACLEGTTCCTNNGKPACCRGDEKLPVFLANPSNDDEIKDCGGSDNHMHVTSSSITPDPPKAGSLAQLKMTCSLDKDVTAANYKLSVKMGSIKMYSHSGNFCGTDSVNLPLGGKLSMIGLTCPASSGSVDVELDVTMPSATPHATYTIEIDSTDSDSDKLLCASGTLKL